MTMVSRADFARLCGTSRAAISIAIKAQRIVTGDRGRIPVENKVNREYIVAQRAKRGIDIPPGKLKKGKISERKPAAKPRKGQDKEERIPLILQKLRADVRLKTRQASMVQLRMRERQRKLLPMSVADRWFGALNSSLRSFFVDLPARLAPELIALVEAGRKAEVPEVLERELVDAVNRTLAQVDRDTRDYLNANTGN